MLTPDKKHADLAAPTTFRSRPRARRISFSETSLAGDAIGPLEPGCEIVVMSKGQFSLIHALNHILEQTGPADITIATWTAATGDIRQAEQWIQNGQINRLRFIVDPSFKTRKPAFCQALVDAFGPGAIRTARIHAKFAVISNDTWTLAVRTSMNLNPNPRMELIEISDDPALAAFFSDLADDIFDIYTPGVDTNQTRNRFDLIGPKHDSAFPSRPKLPF